MEERTRIRDLAEVFLGQARWEPARGFEVTDDVRLVIATQAVRLLVAHWYQNREAVAVPLFR